MKLKFMRHRGRSKSKSKSKSKSRTRNRLLSKSQSAILNTPSFNKHKKREIFPAEKLASKRPILASIMKTHKNIHTANTILKKVLRIHSFEPALDKLRFKNHVVQSKQIFKESIKHWEQDKIEQVHKICSQQELLEEKGLNGSLLGLPQVDVKADGEVEVSDIGGGDGDGSNSFVLSKQPLNSFRTYLTNQDMLNEDSKSQTGKYAKSFTNLRRASFTSLAVSGKPTE